MTEISRSTISIRFYGKNLDPVFISAQLKGQPDAAAKTGEMIIQPNRRDRLARKGCWRLEYGESDEMILEDKIELLLGKLTDDLAAWQAVKETVEVADIFCGLFLDNWNEGFSLSASTMEKISGRGLEINFDVYSPTDTWYAEDQASEFEDDLPKPG
jgi:hypothetical protein